MDRRTRVSDRADSPTESPCIEMPFIEGPVYGAVVAARPGEAAQWIGASRQFAARSLASHPLARQHPFAYTGSVGPTRFDAEDLAAWDRLLQQMQRQFTFQGLIGIDAIRSPTWGWTLLEINPRWTASVELHEFVLDRSLFSQHVAGSQKGTRIVTSMPAVAGVQPATPQFDPPLKLPSGRRPMLPKYAAKRIIWSRNGTRVTRHWRQRLAEWADQFGMMLRDVPHVGTRIEPLRPVFTVLVGDSDGSTAWKRIDSALARLPDNGDKPLT